MFTSSVHLLLCPSENFHGFPLVLLTMEESYYLWIFPFRLKLLFEPMISKSLLIFQLLVLPFFLFWLLDWSYFFN